MIQFLTSTEIEYLKGLCGKQWDRVRYREYVSQGPLSRADEAELKTIAGITQVLNGWLGL